MGLQSTGFSTHPVRPLMTDASSFSVLGMACMESVMESEPANIFRGLPLTSEQDSEIRHYIHCRQRNGLPWETPELRAMLADMLNPPEVGEEDQQALSDSMDVNRSAAQDDQTDLH